MKTAFATYGVVNAVRVAQAGWGAPFPGGAPAP
jgi:hypothetical protein